MFILLRLVGLNSWRDESLPTPLTINLVISYMYNMFFFSDTGFLEICPRPSISSRHGVQRQPTFILSTGRTLWYVDSIPLLDLDSLTI